MSEVAAAQHKIWAALAAAAPLRGLPLHFPFRDLAQKEVAEDLDALGIAQFFRIDEIGIDARSLQLWQHPNEVGEEVLIGKGLVDFRQVFTKLHRLGYKGAVSIEREISGPQQIEDVKIEKAYLERVIREVNA